MAQPVPYEILGGEPALHRLIERFYDLMDSEPEYHGIRKLHPGDLAGSREKLFMFLSGWLGGPSLYTEKHGPPMLRARHLPFAIGRAERDAWMDCMRRALEDTQAGNAAFRAWLLGQFFATADWMRNRPGDMPGQA